MRIVAAITIGLTCCAPGGAPAQADHAPVYVIPGRPGTPVVINGFDASYTVVEGDWGLYRPGHVPPSIVSGPLITPAPYYAGHYFPWLGRQPGYGRREIEPPPNRRPPRPAPTYYREWSAHSDSAPATLDAPDNPELEISAEIDRRWDRRPRPRPRPRPHRR
jgi:hypothetical protein